MNQALISELDKIPFSKSFSGHETFAFRYSWLKKGVDFLTVDPAIFQSAEASVRFGVGKNMVRSIRHWCLATWHAPTKDTTSYVRVKDSLASGAGGR